MKLSKFEQYRQSVLQQKMLEAGTPSDIHTLKNLVESHGHVFPRVPKSTSIMIWPIEYVAADMSKRKLWRIFHGSERKGIFTHAFDTVTYEPVDEDASDQRQLNQMKIFA
jgi:hypothetical protein